jgi:hypothetical protein
MRTYTNTSRPLHTYTYEELLSMLTRAKQGYPQPFGLIILETAITAVERSCGMNLYQTVTVLPNSKGKLLERGETHSRVFVEGRGELTVNNAHIRAPKRILGWAVVDTKGKELFQNNSIKICQHWRTENNLVTCTRIKSIR